MKKNKSAFLAEVKAAKKALLAGLKGWNGGPVRRLQLKKDVVIEMAKDEPFRKRMEQAARQKNKEPAQRQRR